MRFIHVVIFCMIGLCCPVPASGRGLLCCCTVQFPWVCSSPSRWLFKCRVVFLVEKYEYFSLKTQLPEFKKHWDNPLRHRVECLCKTRSWTW